MKSLARISAIGVVGLGLGAVGVAFGQSGTSPVATNATSRGPSSVAVAAGAKPSVSAANRQSEPIGPNDTSPKLANPTNEPKSSGGGYTWTEKRSRPTKHKKVVALDPTRPVAQAPNFAMRADGSSVVTLVLSQAVQVTRANDGERVEYRLKDAQIGVSNNMNPLVTAHFATPVQRIVMQRTRDGAVLILELREQVSPMHQTRSSPAGGVVLEISLPKPSRSYPPPAIQQRPPPADEVSAGPDSTRRGKRRNSKGTIQKPGPGPRL